MLKLPSVFKKVKNKQYNYRPRYYDPVREEIEEKIQRKQRLDELDAQSNTNSAEEGQIAKENLRREFSRFKAQGNQEDGRKSLFTMLLTLLILLMGGLLIFGTGEAFYGKTQTIQWNDYLTYGMLLLCIIYFLFRFRKLSQK